MAQGQNAAEKSNKGYEWGSRRWPGDYRFPGKITKNFTHRYERRVAKAEIAEALADAPSATQGEETP